MIAGVGNISWKSGHAQSAVKDSQGRWVDPRRARLMWVRRVGGNASLPEQLVSSARDLVERDCRAALSGLLETEFAGSYISHPDATRRAENKLVQLRAAMSVGLTVPETLVSSDPGDVRDFCRQHNYQVVAKTLSGSVGNPTLTGRVTPELLVDETIAMSPTIFQKLIPGNEHLRVHVFGDQVYCALLRSDRLDWRYPLDCQVTPHRLESATASMLVQVLDKLHLRMGIFDLKLDSDGQPTWLEVNPQGQFLWVQGMSGLNLADAFVDFLEAELTQERSTQLS